MIATVRLGAASGNGFAPSTAAISAAVRTITPTGLPAYAASARSKLSLTSDALRGLSSDVHGVPRDEVAGRVVAARAQPRHYPRLGGARTDRLARPIHAQQFHPSARLDRAIQPRLARPCRNRTLEDLERSAPGAGCDVSAATGAGPRDALRRP